MNEGFRGLHLTLAECRALWTALRWRCQHLTDTAAATRDEDERLTLDEELQDLAGVQISLAIYARSTYRLELDRPGSTDATS